MSSISKAKDLVSLMAQLSPEPLPVGDERYVDVSGGRGTAELKKLVVFLRDTRASGKTYATAAFSGHRGSGKSTELLRIAHRLSDEFTVFRVVLDESLRDDCDFSDLVLWLTESLVRESRDLGVEIDQAFIADLGRWFGERAFERIAEYEELLETERGGGANAGGEAGGFLGAKLFARIRSHLRSDEKTRRVFRTRFHSYVTDLIAKFNLLLGEISTKLDEAGKPREILVIQDNLDRLSQPAAARLFHEQGDLLRQLHMHAVYTVPIATMLAPYNIRSSFDQSFAMPMLKVRDQDGNIHQPGIDALLAVLDARMDIDRIFETAEVAEYLARMSGGSTRNLIELVNESRLSARAESAAAIAMTHAEDAVAQLRMSFEDMLRPGSVYYPILAEIAENKQDYAQPGTVHTTEDVAQQRRFFCELLFNGSVIEYNGQGTWFDVHPIVQQIKAFQDAYNAT